EVLVDRAPGLRRDSDVNAKLLRVAAELLVAFGPPPLPPGTPVAAGLFAVKAPRCALDDQVGPGPGASGEHLPPVDIRADREADTRPVMFEHKRLGAGREGVHLVRRDVPLAVKPDWFAAPQHRLRDKR